jgi:hypothetical protein
MLWIPHLSVLLPLEHYYYYYKKNLLEVLILIQERRMYRPPALGQIGL